MCQRCVARPSVPQPSVCVVCVATNPCWATQWGSVLLACLRCCFLASQPSPAPWEEPGQGPPCGLLPCGAAAPWQLPLGSCCLSPASRGLAVVRKVTSSSNSPAGCTATHALTTCCHATHPTHATCACEGASFCGSPCRGGSGNYLSQVKRPKAYSLPASIPHLLTGELARVVDRCDSPPGCS